METLYRGMIEDADGGPRVGASARTLGMRPRIDVPGDASDLIDPGVGGMSASLGDPMLLPIHRRPPEFEGTGADAVFSIEVLELGPDLRWREDPDGPSGHGFVEPVRTMPFKDVQESIWATRARWRRVDR